MNIGSAFFAGQVLLGIIAAPLLGTPVGWILIGINILSAFGLYISKRLNSPNLKLDRYRENEKKIDSFLAFSKSQEALMREQENVWNNRRDLIVPLRALFSRNDCLTLDQAKDKMKMDQPLFESIKTKNSPIFEKVRKKYTTPHPPASGKPSGQSSASFFKTTDRTRTNQGKNALQISHSALCFSSNN